MIFSGLFTSITCKLRIDELSYCKSIFLEVMTVKKKTLSAKIFWSVLPGSTGMTMFWNSVLRLGQLRTETESNGHGFQKKNRPYLSVLSLFKSVKY